jgi:hypothetical protein
MSEVHSTLILRQWTFPLFGNAEGSKKVADSSLDSMQIDEN